MTKAQQTLAFFALVIAVYQALWLGVIPQSETFANEVVPVLPFTALVAFGSYLLARLGYNVYTFHDVPEAHKELMEQIEQARTELRAKGVDVD